MKKLKVDLKDFTVNGEPALKVLANSDDMSKKRLNDSRIDQFFLDNDFKVHTEKLKKYYDDLSWIGKQHLFIWGSPGTQKTGQVTAIAKKSLQSGKSVRYYRATEIVYQRDLEHVRGYSLVILDNVGYSGKFEESRGLLFDFIDYRIHNYRSTILISNENLSEKFNPAFVDRLKMFVKIKIDGLSLRGVEAKNI